MNRPPKLARRTPVLAALAWIAALQPSPALSAPPEPEAAFLPLWDEMPGRAGWRLLVSPAFPRDWPPPAGPGAVVRYAFAMRLNPAVADGAEMAAPWARLTIGADGAAAVERLSPGLRALGVQGVRPLQAAEIALARREKEAADRLRAGGTQAQDPVVRAFTCGWIARQGVVAAAITPLHPGFGRWLDCPGPGAGLSR